MATAATGGDPQPPLIVLGTGYVGTRLAAAALARGRQVRASSRSPERREALQKQGLEPFEPRNLSRVLPGGTDPCDLVVTIPPDGSSDARYASALPRVRRIVYLSTTAVYPTRVGVIDNTTPSAPDQPRGQQRLQAEACWTGLGAISLRVPAIYGPGRGLHERVRSGRHEIPGDGMGYISRIHVDDLVSFCLAALAHGEQGRHYVVGDLEPAPHIEVVSFICKLLGRRLPPSLPLDRVAPSLRGHRAAKVQQSLDALQVRLRFPTYREGLRELLVRSS